MTLAGRRVAVSLPDTVLEEKESPRDKTVKLGLIARACAIYGVDVIEVFPGGEGGDWMTIKKVLEYLETPQYLRRKLFPIDDTLKFAGVLPPLRIPSHKPLVEVGQVKAGEFREGVVDPDGAVDVGLGERVRVKGKAPVRGRVTVKFTSGKPLEGELVAKEAVSEYWGYAVRRRSAEEILSDRGFGLTIATSKFGDSFRQKTPELQSRLKEVRGVRLVFGSPSRGLFDTLGRDLRGRVGMVLNLFPEQRVETVRSEEAMFAGLALLNVISA